MLRLIAVLFIVVMAVACTNDELCIGKGTNEIKLSFVESGSNPEAESLITFDSIGVSGEPIAYPSFADTTLAALNLQVDPDSTETRFVFITSDRTDTLDLTYRVVPSFISVQCGPELLFSKLDTLNHTFDSLVIVQDIFDSEVETNIKIYY
jgi:hypothetical protein